MCGLVAFNTSKSDPDQLETVCRLAEQASIRGLHAFGFAVAGRGYFHVRKFHKLSEALSEIRALRDVKCLIFHARYSTSGDYNDHDNNQPVTLLSEAMAFNGVIDMGTKAEMEQRYGIEMDTENDGEVLLRLARTSQDRAEFVSRMRGSFAGAFMDLTGRLYVMRNDRRPLWMHVDGEATYYASTYDVFKRSSIVTNVKELVPCTVYDHPSVHDVFMPSSAVKSHQVTSSATKSHQVPSSVVKNVKDTVNDHP